MSNYIRNEIWNKIEGIGNLVIEELLVVGDEPVLFVCTDQKSVDRYLIMTYDSYESVYVISRLSPHIICDMLENKITMDEAFRSASEIVMTKEMNGVIVAEKYDPFLFDEKLLPQKGAFFELNFDYIKRYISVLKKYPKIIVDYCLPFQKNDYGRSVDYIYDSDEKDSVSTNNDSTNVGNPIGLFDAA